jgi:flagellar basal-body rod protein FlgF
MRSATAIQGYTDFSAGPLKATGNPMDVAVADDAFFVVQTSRGERYTRSGSFALDSEGRLVSRSGELVMSAAGPIRAPQSQGPLNIAADGTVSTAKGAIAQLRLVRFDNLRELSPEGGGLFLSDRPPFDVPAAAIRLVAGALEGSNVVAVSEMTKLVAASRAYEEVAKTVMREEDNNELRKLAGPDL